MGYLDVSDPVPESDDTSIDDPIRQADKKEAIPW
jgi:hypothetical protein